MPMNRMPVFALRAAPVQVTYLAYCSTTGLAAMDYRLSDPHLDPPGWDSRYVERTVRLPQSWWLYEAPLQAPDIQPREGPQIVFGSLNNFAKVSPAALQTWAGIFNAVPASRLLLHCPPGKTRAGVSAAFAANGVAADRVEFIERVPLAKYLSLHNQIDIALDPFPYSGGTTTCDALWMGVPVVSLRGDMAVGRGSAGILTNLGLPELIAQTPDEYGRIALALAGDAPRRAELRRGMRERMIASPLMDRAGFMRGLEGAFRAMWREWCAL